MLCLILLSWPLFCTMCLCGQHGLTVLLFLCDIPDMHWKATKKRQIREGYAANRLGRRPKWGGAHWAVGGESGRPSDPSTHGAVCNSSWWEKNLHQSSFAGINFYLSLYSRCRALHEIFFFSLNSMFVLCLLCCIMLSNLIKDIFLSKWKWSPYRHAWFQWVITSVKYAIFT